MFTINALYRPPIETNESHNLFLNTAEQILSDLNEYPATYKIITSDMNFGNIYCKCQFLEPKPLDGSAPDLFASYG